MWLNDNFGYFGKSAKTSFWNVVIYFLSSFYEISKFQKLYNALSIVGVSAVKYILTKKLM